LTDSVIETDRAGHELVMAPHSHCGDSGEHLERTQSAVEVSSERELVATPIGPASIGSSWFPTVT
jgi:hypothetical protein